MGYGEIAPLPHFSQETLEQAHKQLLDLQNGVFDVNKLPSSLFPSVTFGIESAYADLTKPAPLRPLTNFLIAEPTPKQVKKALLLGWKTLKLKIGHLDSASVSALFSIIPPDVKIRLDSNHQLTVEQTQQLWERLALHHHQIEYIEDPTATLEELLYLAHNTQIPLALDNFFRQLPLETLATIPNVKALICKPMLQGGESFYAKYALFPAPLIFTHSYESAIGKRSIWRLIQTFSPSHVHGVY